MINYKQLNVNPKGRKTSDCVIRALATGTGLDYWEVLDGLVEISKKSGYCLLDKKVYEEFLRQQGFYKKPQPRKLDNTKYLVGEIRQLTKRERVIVSMANHLTAVIGDDLIDIWDCRRKTIGNYFIKF